MKIRDPELYDCLHQELDKFSENHIELPILDDKKVKDVFVGQLIDSVRRVKYAQSISRRNITLGVSSPDSQAFNPLKAALYHFKSGDCEEATWLTFLATHFGFSSSSKWLLTSDVYGKLGEKPFWSWIEVSNNLDEFIDWSKNLEEQITLLEPKRSFGNHRKYETLKYQSNRSLSNVVASYVNLVLQHENHFSLFAHVLRETDACEYDAFDYLYNYFEPVVSFGRTARFDFLTMIGKLGIFVIQPPKTYMRDSTGPVKGAKLLFPGVSSNLKLEEYLFRLNENLSINPFGMQVLEDALCNWQKNPSKYVYFGG